MIFKTSPKQLLSLFLCCFFFIALHAQEEIKLKKKDRKRDVELITTEGDIVLRLSDSTPLHRDNFLRLVKSGYYDSLLFHRVIKSHVIQAGDPNSKNAAPGVALGEGGPGYTVPAEFNASLYHHKGALGMARDDNPEKRSSGSQFYIVHGKRYTDVSLDSVETYRIKAKLPADHREVYKTLGGRAYLDGGYTIFGEVVKGFDVLDRIATVPTTKNPPDRPVQDVRILKAQLIKRKKYTEQPQPASL